MTDRASLPFDPVKKAKGYNSHPSGVETKEVTYHLSTALGCALKYIWRAGLKGPVEIDLRKAENCLEDEVARLAEDAKNEAREPATWMLSWRWVEPAQRLIVVPPTNDVERLLQAVVTELVIIQQSPGRSQRMCVERCLGLVRDAIERKIDLP